jgi:hypothetical protein
MAKFQKGKSGNPNGRPKDAVGQAMRVMTAEEFIEIIDLVLLTPTSRLKEIIEDREDEHNQLQRMVASIVVKIVERGDMQALNLLLDRLIGKVKDDQAIMKAIAEHYKRMSLDEIVKETQVAVAQAEKVLKLAR